MIPSQPAGVSAIVQPPPVVLDIEGLRGVVQWSQSRVLENARQDLSSAESEVNRQERVFRDLISRKDSKLRAVASLEKTLSEATLNIDPVLFHLQGLMTSRKFENFTFNANFITALTTTIVIRIAGVIYKMGSFKVKVNISDMDVRFYRYRDNIEDQNMHPHIDGERPCWGNVQAEIPKMIAAGNYGLLFEIVYDFLTSYNSSSPYRRIEAWPKDEPSFVDLARQLSSPVAVAPPVVVVAQTGEDGELITPPAGRWAQLARVNPLPIEVEAPRAVQPARSEEWQTTLHEGSSPTRTAPGDRPVLSERIDRDLRNRGFNPESLNRHQRRTILARMLPEEQSISRNGLGEYQRLLRYYVNWLRRTR